jgi:hypothetical protein
MSEECLAITVVHGATTAAKTKRRDDIAAYLGGGRVIDKATAPVRNGDVMFVDDLAKLNLIASNVLLTADNQAPIFKAISLDDALANLDKAG